MYELDHETNFLVLGSKKSGSESSQRIPYMLRTRFKGRGTLYSDTKYIATVSDATVNFRDGFKYIHE